MISHYVNREFKGHNTNVSNEVIVKVLFCIEILKKFSYCTPLSYHEPYDLDGINVIIFFK